MKTKLPQTIMSIIVIFSTANPLLAQLKIGTNPTIISANANLEVESSAGKKLVLDKASGKLVTTGDVTVQSTNGNAILSAVPGDNNIAPSVKVTGAEFSVGPTGSPVFTVNSAGKIIIPKDAKLKRVLTSNAAGEATWTDLNIIQKFNRISTVTQNEAGFVLPISAGLVSTGAPTTFEDIGLGSVFDVTMVENDVQLDILLGFSSDNPGGGRIGFGVYVFLDNNPVPVANFVHNTDNQGCFGESLNFKTTFKNLAPGAHRVAIKAAPRRNANNQVVQVGIGAATSTGCPSNYQSQKLVLSVYE